MRKLVATGLMAMTFLMPIGVGAAFSPSESGLDTTGGAAYGEEKIATAEFQNIGAFVGTYIIKPVLGLLGLLFLCLMVYAGGLWMTAAGNDKRVAKAKEILVSSVIGAVIIVAAYAATNFLFTALAG